MANIVADRVKERISGAPGTSSTLTLSAAPTGFRRFSSVMSVGDTCYAVIENGAAWEIGIYTYSAANTLTRTTVLKSSNSDSLINVGTNAFVFISYIADKALYKDGSNRAVMGAGGIIFSDSSVQTTAATSPDLSPYLTIAAAASTYAALAGSYLDPAWITGLAWSKISGTPTTLLGYGITDSITSSVAAATYVPYTGATGAVDLGTNALTVGAITASGDLKFTDATYDIGKSGATRPRDGFFSRNLRVESTITTANVTANGVAGDLNLSPTSTGSTASIAMCQNGFVYQRFMPTMGFIQGSGQFIGWDSSSWSTGTSPDLALYRDAAGILHQRNSTNAQAFRLAETYTSSTSFGALQFKANAGAAYQIGSAIGSAGGTTRAITFGHWNAAGTFTSAYTVNTDGSSSVGFNAFYAGRIHGLYTDQILVITTGSAGTEGDSGSSLIFGTASTGARQFRFKYNTTQVMGLSETQGNLSLTPIVATSGSPTVFTVTCPAHTTLTTAEVTDGYFNAARTVNFGATGGTVASQRTWRFTAPTFTAAAATTLTTMSTVSISGPPVASTNVTGTDAYALNVESGKAYFAGQVIVSPAAVTDIYSGVMLEVNKTTASGDGGNIMLSNSTSTVVGASASLRFRVGSNFSSGYSSAKISCEYRSGMSYPDLVFRSYALNGSGSDGGNEAFRIASNAAGSLLCVGIGTGTNSPVSLLDVNGDITTRKGIVATSILVYNTYTSSTSGEWAEFNWQTTTNVLRIGSNKGSAGGSARDIAITHGGTVVANFLADKFYLGPIVDSTATGGDARGQYAVDLQMYRTAATQVASGAASICIGKTNTASNTSSVAIGNDCTASGLNSQSIGNVASATASYALSIGRNVLASGIASTAIGSYNTASGNYSAAFGSQASSDRYGQFSHCANIFAVQGDAQFVRFILRRKTTDATPTTLMLDGSSSRLTIPSGKTMSCKVTVKGIKSDGSAKARFVRLVEITNVGGTTALDMSPEAIGTDYNPSGCVCDITADNTNDALDISVTGITGETWRWVAVVEGLEIAYGT